MQVPIERSTRVSRQESGVWLETLAISGLTLSALVAISAILGPIMAVAMMGLTIAFLLAFMIR